MSHIIRFHSVIKYAGMFPPVANIQEALTLVMRYHIKAEIIGSWLYCFTSPLIGCQLECIGFWYSYKHRAFIFSDTPKNYPSGSETLDQIRARLGSSQFRG